MRIGLVVFTMFACGGGRARDQAGVAREFAAALETENVDAACSYLMDAEACGRDRPDAPSVCLSQADGLREAMPGLAKRFPKGVITAETQAYGNATFGSWSVEVDGAPAADIWVQTINGRAYVAWVSLTGDHVVTDH